MGREHDPLQAISHGPRNERRRGGHVNYKPRCNEMADRMPKNLFVLGERWHARTVCIRFARSINRRLAPRRRRFVIRAKSGLLDRALVKLDDVLGYGSPKPTFRFGRATANSQSERQVNHGLRCGFVAGVGDRISSVTLKSLASPCRFSWPSLSAASWASKEPMWEKQQECEPTCW